MVRKSYYLITRTFRNGIFDDAHEEKSSVLVRKVKRTRRSHAPRKSRRTTFDDRFGFESDYFDSEAKMNRYMDKNNLTNILKRK